jgi:threonine aldolase
MRRREAISLLLTWRRQASADRAISMHTPTMIDLRSDTGTPPTRRMREMLADAEVGDDYYGDDVNAARLERHCAELLGKEAAVFVTTGMMANHLAIAAQVPRGDEVITEYGYHINLFESAQYAELAHVVLNGWHTGDGILRVEDIRAAIASKPRGSLYAQARLIAVENTVAGWQGKLFPIEELQRIRRFAIGQGLHVHLDGARLVNAHVASGTPLAAYGREVDTISLAFSKGLGAPFGAILAGTRHTIERARQLRMRYGSGFHQIGIYAQAAYFALTEQLDRIADDHRLTRLLAEGIASVCPALLGDPVESNILFLYPRKLGIDDEAFVERCVAKDLRVSSYPPDIVRLVVARPIDETDVRAAVQIVSHVARSFTD